MKLIFILLSLLLNISCGENKDENGFNQSLNSSEEITYSITESHTESGVEICYSYGKARGQAQLCKLIMKEYEQGECERYCAKLLYQSAGCGEIEDNYTTWNVSCGNTISN